MSLSSELGTSSGGLRTRNNRYMVNGSPLPFYEGVLFGDGA